MNKKNIILVSIIILSILLSLVPAFRFLIRLAPAFFQHDLAPAKTSIGTEYGDQIGSVFNTIYNGGSNLLHGKNIYDIENIGIDIPGGAFVYPPLMAAVGLAFTAFSLSTAYFVFFLALLLSVSLFLSYGIKHIYALNSENLSGHKKNSLAIIFIMLVLLSTPLVRQLQWGHYILIVLALYTIVYFYDKNHGKKWYVTGIATGLASSLMLYSAILFPYLILRRRFKEFFLGIAVFILSFLPFIFNPSSAAGFLTFLKNADKLAFVPKLETGGTFFSLQKLLYEINPLLQKFYLLLNLILFLYITVIIWNNTEYGKSMNQNIYRIYYALILLFILIIDIWLSEHHLPIILLALLLLIGEKYWQIMLTVSYLMTNTFLYDFHIKINGAFLYTYIRQLGLIVLFLYTTYLIFDKMSKLRFNFSPVPKLRNH
ncbi:DUF2029 domain-containing protein [Candidatus Woesearchaeota archaeon]|nr:DUF2029 domain-containing protein [Candidatus Woesearchaeota archaeon]